MSQPLSPPPTALGRPRLHLPTQNSNSSPCSPELSRPWDSQLQLSLPSSKSWMDQTCIKALPLQKALPAELCLLYPLSSPTPPPCWYPQLRTDGSPVIFLHLPCQIATFRKKVPASGLEASKKVKSYTFFCYTRSALGEGTCISYQTGFLRRWATKRTGHLLYARYFINILSRDPHTNPAR